MTGMRLRTTSPRPASELSPAWCVALDDNVSALAVDPQGKLAVVGTMSGTALALRLDGSIVRELPEHPLGSSAAAWSNDGEHFATGGQDGRTRLYSRAACADPTVPPTASIERKGWVASLCWSPRADHLAAIVGKTVLVIAVDGSLVLEQAAHASTLTGVAWSVDGSRVGVSCYGGVTWYEVADPAAPPKVFAWKGSLLSLDVAPNGKFVAGGCQDAAVHVWRLWSGDDFQMSGYPAKVEHVAWDHTGRFMAVGNVGEVTVWDYSGRGPQGTRPTQLDGHDRHVSALAFQHRGGLLASGGADGLVMVWDPPKRSAPLHSVELSEGVASAAWGANDQFLLVGTELGQVLRFDLPT